jgi:hypothetical protein
MRLTMALSSLFFSIGDIELSFKPFIAFLSEIILSA